MAANSFGSILKWIETAPVFGRPRPRLFSVRDIGLVINFTYQKIVDRASAGTPYAAYPKVGTATLTGKYPMSGQSMGATGG
jgi:hypothetical protein